MASLESIHLPPLSKKSINELVTKATLLGFDPGDYARRIIEDSLAFQREAEESSFSQIMGPVGDASAPVSDDDIVRLVKKARKAIGSRETRSKR